MLAEAETPLSERVIKDTHSLVLMNDTANKGTYRTISVAILGAMHTPSQAHLVPIQMEQLILDYEKTKQEVHTIEAIAEFHLRFEGIHPFIDGNGRTGRLLLNLELIKAGLLPVNIKFSDRRKYYESFDKYYGDKQNSNALASLIADYQIEELTKYIAMIGQIL